MDIDIADDPLLIDHKNGALRTAFVFSKDIIFFGYRTVGPEIAEQGIIDAAQALSPGFDRRDRIGGDAQDLGI